MNEEEKAVYQTEITRLNKIISLVLEQNDLLKREISYLKTVIGQSNITLPDHEIGVGQSKEEKSNDKTVVGQLQHTMSDPKTVVGQGINAMSDDKTEVGQLQHTMSDHKTGVGQSKNTMSNDKTIIGQTQPTRTLPDILPATPPDVQSLSYTLQDSGLRHMTRAARYNAAKLLIHFYNKSLSDYPELRKLTGLSQGGLSKFMTSLRRRGLIHGAGWQKYAPTAHALQLMQKVFGK